MHGKELSYNNLVDLDAAWQLVNEFTGPAAAIIKHTNPAGCAEQETLAEAYRKALESDPVSEHVKSNAIVYARAGQTVGVGAGQMSRVDSVKIGAIKAVLSLAGTVVGSDAFFPFSDGVEEAAKNGATAVIQPGGSVNDAQVITAADRLGLAMVFTGVRHFRH